MLTDMFLGKYVSNLGGKPFLRGPGAARKLAATRGAAALSAKEERGHWHSENARAENRMKTIADLTGNPWVS